MGQATKEIDLFSTVNGVKTSVKMKVRYLQGNEVETMGGTSIHVFDRVPYMRPIKANEGWFKSPVYSWN